MARRPLSDPPRSTAAVCAAAAAALLAATGCGPADAGTGTVTGTVTDTSGAPIADCAMVPEVTSGSVPAMNGRGHGTDRDGGYTIPLPPATYTLTADCSGGRESAELVVDFELPPIPEPDPHTPVSPPGTGSPPRTDSPNPPTAIPGMPPQRTPPPPTTVPDDPSGF